MGTHFQVILEFYGDVVIAIMILLHLGQDIGLAAVPEIPGAIVFLVGYRSIAIDADGFTEILLDRHISSISQAAGGNPKLGTVYRSLDGIADFLQLVFRSRPAGNIICTVPGRIFKAGDIVSGALYLPRADDRLFAHDHRAGRHRIETGDILGQLQGKGGIAIRILAGNDADVVVLRGICGIIHQFIPRDTAFDGHFLIERGVGCFTIITRELQTIFQRSDGMGMLAIAGIRDAGHVGLQGSLRIILGILIACADGNRLD